jgi:hypothetical protein
MARKFSSGTKTGVRGATKGSMVVPVNITKSGNVNRRAGTSYTH